MNVDKKDLPDLFFYNTQNDKFVRFNGNNCQGFAQMIMTYDPNNGKINDKIDTNYDWQCYGYTFKVFLYVVPLLFWSDCEKDNIPSFESCGDLSYALGMPKGCSLSDKFLEVLKSIRPNLYAAIKEEE